MWEQRCVSSRAGGSLAWAAAFSWRSGFHPASAGRGQRLRRPWHPVLVVGAGAGAGEGVLDHHSRTEVDPVLLGPRMPLSNNATTYYTGHQADAPSKEVWRRKRIGWLCKELPVRRGREIAGLLKDQRKWIKWVDAQKVMEQLLFLREYVCCYHVYKWAHAQPWYEFEYGLTTRIANSLALDRKASKAHDLLDIIMRSGSPPDAATFSSVIVAYIKEGQEASVREAWAVYNQMNLVGGYDPPLTVQNKLFSALVCMADDVPEFGEHADVVFHHIVNAGHPFSTEMCESLMGIHGRMGNRRQLWSVVGKLERTQLRLGLAGFTSILQLCAKEGDVEGAERAWLDMDKAGMQPDGPVYLQAMKTYRRAGLPWKVHQTFQEMVSKGMEPSYMAYLVVLQGMADAGEETCALEFLDCLRSSGMTPLLPAYNAIMGMYLRMEAFDKVKVTFDQMQGQQCRPNRDSYNTLIESYTRAGLLKQAEEVFEFMLNNYHPNQRTYNIMLQGYGAEGNLSKVKQVVSVMNRHCQVEPQNREVVTAAFSSPTASAEALPAAPHDLTLESCQRETLVGLLLGGAHIGSDDDGLTFHVRVDLDPTSSVAISLLQNLNTIFAEWTESPPPDGTHPSLLQFLTINHPSLRFFASQYRPGGRPAIPRLIHRWLTPRALAYWYMLSDTKTGDIMFHIPGYSSEDIVLLSKALKAKGLDCTGHKDGRIHLSEQGAQLAWELMETHLLVEVRETDRPRRSQSHPVSQGPFVAHQRSEGACHEINWASLNS